MLNLVREIQDHSRFTHFSNRNYYPIDRRSPIESFQRQVPEQVLSDKSFSKCMTNQQIRICSHGAFSTRNAGAQTKLNIHNSDHLQSLLCFSNDVSAQNVVSIQDFSLLWQQDAKLLNSSLDEIAVKLLENRLSYLLGIRQ